MLIRTYQFSYALQQQVRPQLWLQIDKWGLGCFIQHHLCQHAFKIWGQSQYPVNVLTKLLTRDQHSLSACHNALTLALCNMNASQEGFSPAPSQHRSGLFIPSQGTLALFLLKKGRWEQTQTTLQRTVTFPLLLKPKGQLHSLFLPSCSWINHSSCPPRDASYFTHGSDFNSLLPPPPKILNLSEVPP